MLRTHYRQPIDWTVKALEEAEATLDRWYDAVDDVESSSQVSDAVLGALNDDLNTPDAVFELHRLAHPARARVLIAGLGAVGQEPNPQHLKSSANLLGLLRQTRSERQALAFSDARIDAVAIEAIVADRSAARAARNWAESDRLRDELSDLGVAIRDNKDGTTTWEPKR
jgi:cysteinyl-tRNA synthetase